MKSERGQAAILVGLLLIFVVGAIFMVLVGLPGMKQGADTIGETVAEGMEDALEPTAAEQEWRNINWQVRNGTVVSFWVNQQRITPNKHAIARHQDDAWAATNCYNDHGAFIAMANKDLDFYLPCREEDGKVRLTIWKRESPTSDRFQMVDAYTPKDGVWSRIEFWLRNTHGATKASFPPDTILIIDNVIP